jgi:N-acetylmuramoyl-L-alanine amidase
MVDSQTMTRNMNINQRISIVNQYAREIKKLAPAHTTVLISLHANSSRNPMAKGLEVFVNTEKKWMFSDGDLFEKHSVEAANLFADNLVQYTGLELRSRGGRKHIESFHAKAGDIGILKRTECYAFLTESGFFTNEEDRALMSTRSFKVKVAYAHYATIMAMEGIEKLPIENFLNN